MSLSPGLEQLFEDGRRNAVVSWLLVALLAATGVGIVVVTGPLWSLFALVLVGLALIPPIAYRSPYVMLPWVVLLVAGLPIVGLTIGSPRLASQFTAYVAVAAIALVIVVEFESFTPVRLSPGFAILLVVVATLAAAALWSLVQWGSDVYLGTDYITTNEELMYEWLYSALAGVFAGGVFTLYFRRHASIDPRLFPGKGGGPADDTAEGAPGDPGPEPPRGGDDDG